MADVETRERTLANRAFQLAEGALYIAVSLVLLAAAVAILIATAYHLVTDLSDGTHVAVRTTLDGLLLTFILIELLAAVRVTLRERQLVAEPFLLVGIIAGIKEVVVIAVGARDLRGERFDDAITQIAVLGLLILVLCVSTILVRAREREPLEGASEPPPPARRGRGTS